MTTGKATMSRVTPAHEALSTARAAQAGQYTAQLDRVSADIQSAAEAGRTATMVNGPLFDSVSATLAGAGYRINVGPTDPRDGSSVVEISWATPKSPTRANGGPGTNTGHGHVWRRPDGRRDRCGGPRVCDKCSRDAAEWAVSGE